MGVMKGRGGITLTRQISSECVQCVSFRWPKTTILANFDIWGAPVRIPFTDEGKFSTLEQSHSICLCARFRLDRFILSLYGGKKIFAVFFGLRHFVVSPVGSYLRKLHTGAQPQCTLVGCVVQQ